MYVQSCFFDDSQMFQILLMILFLYLSESNREKQIVNGSSNPSAWSKNGDT